MKEKIIVTYHKVTEVHCSCLLYYLLGPSCIWSVDKSDSTHYLLSINLVMCYLFLPVYLYCIDDLFLIYQFKHFIFTEQDGKWHQTVTYWLASEDVLLLSGLSVSICKDRLVSLKYCLGLWILPRERRRTQKRECIVQ